MLKRIPKEVSKEGLLPRDKHRNYIMVKVNVDTRGNFDLEKFKREYDFSEHNGYYDHTTIITSGEEELQFKKYVKEQYMANLKSLDNS